MNVRVLPPEEWPRLMGTEAETLWPVLTNAEVVVVEDDDGEIVGTWTLMWVPHAECVWIAPEHRGSFAVVRRLLDGMYQTAGDRGISLVTCGASSPQVGGLIERLGGYPVPGVSYFLPIRRKEESWATRQQCRPWRVPESLREEPPAIKELSKPREEVGKWD